MLMIGLAMSRKPRKKHVQLTLDQARRACGRGGWRPGAGRPKTSRRIPHSRREPIPARFPQHVSQRVVIDVTSLRKRKVMQLVLAAIARSHRDDFRVVEFVVESNHLHLIIEAASNEARARDLKGLKVSIARQLNRALGRCGAVFDDRYHSRVLRTPREVRNAIRYVLNNTRHHDPLGTYILDASWIDPCSSAAWFDGWAQAIEPDTWWKRELLEQPAPTRRARTWLLSVGWRRHGALRFDEAPANNDRH
jgi:REP element-mobilizing transposase RayT